MYEQPPVQPALEPAPKNTNIALIAGIAAVIILCCCCVIVIGGYAVYSISSTVQETYSSFETFMTPGAPGFEEFPAIPEIPEIPTSEPGMPAIPSIPELPSTFDDLIPQGGLGDDLLRTDTWVYVMAGAAMTGCTVTEPSQTVIEVLAQPDSAGVWQEKWTVTCEDGSTKSFDVTFSPSAQGGTDISVKQSN